MKANVDILTMTATPIPRTLHMALLGIRDLSVINTPPEGRFPVQTYVMEYSDELVVSAVRRELDRDGQVYVIYNRVQGIDALASRLRRLLPGVSIGVIHGQMSETLLERTMLDFYEGNYQVLLSTTIIENGLISPMSIQLSSMIQTDWGFPSSTSCGDVWAGEENWHTPTLLIAKTRC